MTSEINDNTPSTPVVMKHNRNLLASILSCLRLPIVTLKRSILVLTWVSALCCVMLLALVYKGKPKQFFGIAGSREQSISFQHPVEILHIAVVEGEEVEQTTPLVEVRRYDLISKQAIIEDNITELKSRHSESLAATRAKLESLRAQQQAELVEIDTQIQSLESRHTLNLSLMKDISGADPSGENSHASPLLAEVDGLKEKRSLIKMSLQAQIDNLENQLETDLRPADAQIAELEKRKTELQRQAEDLKVSAKFNGSIGSVLYKPGEQVRPFSPILTLHSSFPSFIKGYIHEELLNDVAVGQPVWAESSCNAREKRIIRGLVESLGSRIVEYPERLQRNPMVAAWGREVIIHLDNQNSLLLGEKVRILLERPKTISEQIDSFNDKIAGTYSDLGEPKSIKEWMASITDLIAECYAKIGSPESMGDWGQSIAAIVPGSYADVGDTVTTPVAQPLTTTLVATSSTRIEASGIVWDKRKGTYLLVTDETMKSGPTIYEMDNQGRLLGALPIKVAENIDDIESISTDGQYFYIASSLSHTKKGNLSPKRRRLVRLQRVEKNLEVYGEIDLYEILRTISEYKTVDSATRDYLAQAIKNDSINIEAHAVINNTLYLGFKSPFDGRNNTIILKIIGVEALFADGNIVSATIWQKLKLTDPESGNAARLTDMVILNEQLFLLGVLKHRRHSRSCLWRYNINSKRLTQLATFPGLQAEGLSINKNLEEAMVVFDGDGQDPSRYTLHNLSTGVNHDNN